jgi:glycerophosphoryl diester phosphodiesterase
MLILSHRGFAQAVPENTLEAFERAVHLGVDGIETDLRLSRAGEVLLYHDRLAPDGREVREFTRAELSAAVGYQVPLLTDAIDAWSDILWVLELKTPEVLDAAADVIRRFLPARRMLAISFWHNAIVELCGRVDVDGGFTCSHRPLDAAELLVGRAANSRIRTLVWNYEFFDEDVLRKCRAAGIQSMVYGVETRADHDRCAAWELDGVMTDYPQYYL